MNRSASVTGTWGRDKNPRSRASATPSEHYTTVTRDSFNTDSMKVYKEKTGSKFSKFHQEKKRGTLIDYTKLEPEEDTRTQQHQQQQYYHMSSSPPMMKVSLNRTRSTMTGDHDGPIAMGRSGVRPEKGISCSGLLGERLCISEDPRLNSFVQRSWLYDDDKSLNYRKNDNIPTLKHPEGLSLNIGENSEEKFKGWAYGRKAVLTGDILSVSGSEKAGVYLDNNNFPLLQKPLFDRSWKPGKSRSGLGTHQHDNW